MNSNLIENRHIRIFISSTFRDMQDERDYLMKRTFPKLRKLAAERDVTLTELDLRWGITEEESKSGKVVEICLREIENSLPFFIGIIGNRYGWIPQKEDLGGNVTEHFNEVNNYIERHLSVTEMEMQFGVLSREEDMHPFFFIKEQEEESDNPEMLNHLKEEVRRSKYPSSIYKSLEDLAAQIEKAFITLLDSLFPNSNLTDIEKERISQRAFMNQLCQNYIKDEKSFKTLDSWLEAKEDYHFVVTGASGLGKSALIANWVKEKLNSLNHDYDIIYHFTGNGGSESSSDHIIRTLISEINEIYGWENTDSKSKLEDLFYRVSSEGNKPLLIIIDAINQIVDTDNAKLLKWLPQPTKNIKILFSTLEDDRTMEIFKGRDYPIYTLNPLDHKRRSLLVKSYLRLYAKSLSEKQSTRIVTDSKCENTLVLKTLLDELIKFGIYENLDNRIEYYLSSETIEDFYQAFLASYEEEYGREYVEMILSVIAVSKYGLSEQEILDIVEGTPLAWSQIYCSFAPQLISKKGIISFSHIHVREAIEHRYLKDKGRSDKYRNKIIDYFKQINSKRGLMELLFQYNKLEKIQEIYEILSKKEVLEMYLDSNTIDFYQYWNTVQHLFGQSKFNVYLEKISDNFNLLIDTALFFSDFFDSIVSIDYLAKARKLLTSSRNLSYLSAMGKVLDSKVYYKRLLWYLNETGKRETIQFVDALINLSKRSVIEGTPYEEEIDLENVDSERRLILSTGEEVYIKKDKNDNWQIISSSESIDRDDLNLTAYGLDYKRRQILRGLNKEDKIFKEFDFEFEKYNYQIDLRLCYLRYALDIVKTLGPDYSYKKYHIYVYLHEIYGGSLSRNQNEYLPLIDEALDFFIKLKTKVCPEVIYILRSKGKIYCQIINEEDTERVNEVKNLYYDLFEIASKYYGNKSTQLADMYLEFTLFLDKIGDFKEEFKYYNKILNIHEYLQLTEILEEDINFVEKYLIKRYFELGTKYKHNGDLMNCINNRIEILNWHIKYSHPFGKAVATAYNNVGAQYRDLGEYDKALEYIGKAYEISKETGRTEYEAVHLNRLGRVYALIGDVVTAKAKFEEAISLLPADHPEAINSREYLNSLKQ